MKSTIIAVGIAPRLLGKVRSALLGLLFSNPERAYYLRETVRATGMGHGAVQRELALLASMGLITRRESGHQVYYQANRDSPLFHEFCSLMRKTTGCGPALQEALAPYGTRVGVAFIYGSYARGEERPDSDIDLLIVGEVSLREIAGTLAKAGDRLGREINAAVYRPQEFGDKARAGHHFIARVLSEPKIFVIGDADGLAEIAG